MTLGKIGDARAAEPLMKTLEKDKNWFVRGESAEALRKINDPRTTESFRRVLVEDDHWYVRKTAVRFLGGIGDNRDAELFLIALQDEDSEVREHAALALDKIGWKPANDLEHASYLAAKQQWTIFVSLGAHVIGALSVLLKDRNRDDREELIEILKDICHSIEVITFGSNKPDGLNKYSSPDVSELTLPISLLKRIEIYTETYDFYQIERFITYAVNYIGQKHLKEHIEVHIYGDPDKLHPNLRNTFKNLCKCVNVHEKIQE
jgi:hypothetical protein